MKKRFLSLLIVTAMLMGLSNFSVLAASNGIPYSSDYSEDVSTWQAGTVSTTNVFPPFTFVANEKAGLVSSAVKGAFSKAADDQSHKFFVPKGTINQVNTYVDVLKNLVLDTSTTTVRLSFAMATEEIAATDSKGFDSKINNAFAWMVQFSSIGYINVLGKSTITYKTNTWYNFDIVFYRGTKNYDVYINGQKVYTNNVSGSVFSGTYGALINQLYGRFETNVTNLPTDFTLYMDDYSVAYDTNVNTNELTTNVLSNSEDVTIDYTNRLITANNTTTVSQLFSSLALPEGYALEAYNSDRSAANVEQELKTGMMVYFVTPNGKNKLPLDVRNLADGIVVNENFNNTIGVPVGFVSGNMSGSVRYFDGVGGVGGKAENDKSIHYAIQAATGNSSKNMLLDKKFNSNSRTIFEYSVLKKDYNSSLRISSFKTTDNITSLAIPNFNSNGTIANGSIVDTGLKYKLNRWYRVGVDIKVGGNTYDYYINGEKVLTDVVIKPDFVLPEIGTIRLDSLAVSDTVSSDTYIDDYKIYNGVYDNSRQITELSSSTVTVNNIKKTIKLPSTMAVDVLKSALNLVKGTMINVYDEQGAVVTGDVKIGDTVSILAPDGLTFNYYEIVPDVLIEATPYAIIDNSISEVPFYTSVDAFLNNITLDVAEATKELYKDGVKVIGGNVESGMTLRYANGNYQNTMTVTLSSKIIETDFSEFLGKKLYDGVASPVYPNGFTVADLKGSGLTETEASSYIEGVNLAGKGDVLKFYAKPISEGSNQQTVYTNFTKGKYKGGIYTLEFSVMAPDKNTDKVVNFKGTIPGGSDSFWTTLISLNDQGKISFFEKPITDYQINKWYHFIVSVDLKTKNATLIINGAKVIDNEYIKEMVQEDITHLRLQNRLKYDVESGAYFDDVKFYPTNSVNFYDAVYDTTISSDKYYIDYANSRIKFLNKGEILEELFAVLVLPESNFGLEFFDAQGNIIEVDKPATVGTVIKVTSENGLAVREYFIDDSFDVGNIYFSADTLIAGDLTASVDVKKFENSITSGTLIMAIYESGVLSSLKTANYDFAIPTGAAYLATTKSIVANVETVTPNTTVKVMFVNDITKLMPYTTVASLSASAL